MVTPVKADNLEQLLKATNYDKKETRFLVNGFRYGFPLCYKGPRKRQDRSKNIPFTVGNKEEMWEKMMKETESGRFAGPFQDIPYEHYVQSPIGLVPKSGGKTRLIFHLSYDFPNGNKSLNHWTPKELCSVRYNDLDYAVRTSLKFLKKKFGTFLFEDQEMNQSGNNKSRKTIFFAKSDLLSAFRILPILPKDRRYLIMAAQNPDFPGKFFYFADKALPFGSSVSCSHFTRFSNALRHIVEKTTSKQYQMSNYLDDFLFLSDSEEECNRMVRTFLNICDEIGFPVSLEKTEWASKTLVFLGILLDGEYHRLCIPLDKVERTTNMLQLMISKKKATVKQLERLSGHLNFLHKAIVPGRVFTRRMYAKFTGQAILDKNRERKLKHFHHIRLDREFKSDCSMWLNFLSDQSVVNRPFMDLSKSVISQELNFYTDSSGSERLGFGIIFMNRWSFGKWEPGFIKRYNPSIQFLELFALCVGIFIFQENLSNTRITVFCDNKSVVGMVNTTVSGCGFCMGLLRMLTINNMKYNRRVFCEHVEGIKNEQADNLSRLNFTDFFRKAPENVHPYPEKLPTELWPLSDLWKRFAFEMGIQCEQVSHKKFNRENQTDC